MEGGTSQINRPARPEIGCFLGHGPFRFLDAQGHF